MRHGILIVWLVLLAVPAFADDEPMHEGKKLSAWIKQMDDKDSAKRAEAARAIGIIGPKGKAAVPGLTKLPQG